MTCTANFTQVIPVQLDCAVPIAPGKWRADQPPSFAVRIDYSCPAGEAPPAPGCVDGGVDPAAWTMDVVTIDRITGQVIGSFAVAGECAGLKVLQLDRPVPPGVYKVGGPDGTYEIEVVREELATAPLDLACAGAAPAAGPPLVTSRRGCGCDAGAVDGVAVLAVIVLAAWRLRSAF